MKSRISCLPLVFVLLAMLLVSGCISLPGGIAPSTTPIEGRKYKVLGRVEATDSCYRLLGFIPISGSNKISDAVKDAIECRKGDALIEVTVDFYTQFWLIYTRHVTRVEGIAIKFER